VYIKGGENSNITIKNDLKTVFTTDQIGGKRSYSECLILQHYSPVISLRVRVDNNPDENSITN
jgi:hypothetical protein